MLYWCIFKELLKARPPKQESYNKKKKKWYNTNVRINHLNNMDLWFLNKYMTASILTECEQNPMTFCGYIIKLNPHQTFSFLKAACFSLSLNLSLFFFFWFPCLYSLSLITLTRLGTTADGPPRHNSNRFFVQTKDKEGYSNDLLISKVENWQNTNCFFLIVWTVYPLNYQDRYGQN